MDRPWPSHRPSILLVEVLDELDVAVVVVEFGVENIPAVWRNGQSWECPATANLEYRAHFRGGEVEEVERENIASGLCSVHCGRPRHVLLFLHGRSELFAIEAKVPLEPVR